MKKRIVTTRLMVLSMVLLVLFLTLAIAAYLSGREIERDSVLISADAVPGSIDAHAMKTALARSLSYEVAAVLAGEAQTQAANLAQARSFDATFQEALARYRSTIRINPDRDRALAGNLAAHYATFAARREVFEGLVHAGDRAGISAFLERELMPAHVAASQAADELVDYNQANARHYAETIAQSIRRLQGIVVGVLVLAMVCGAILAGTLSVRRREGQQLLENERRLRQVLDNLFAFVGLLELDGTLVEVNRAPLEASGLRREDVVGRHFSQTYWLMHDPAAQTKLRAALREAAAGKVVRYDMEVRVGAGRVFTVDFSCGPFRDSTGRVTQLVATAVNISERKKLEQQFLRAQRMEAIGMLSSGLAHDLNNILASMLMGAGLLKMKLDSPRDERTIDMIEAGAQRGADIIRQLLTFGRGSGGNKVAVQMRHLLKDMVHIIGETFPRNIELENRAPHDLWPLMADATQLHQMLLNLCLNARDAMPQGGKLMLSMENLHLDEEGAQVHLQARPGRHVLVTVADTGEGITPEMLDRIFDPFFTTKPVGKGTGLGLPSVLGIVKGHGGFLTVDSVPGQGTTFRIYLPAAELSQAAKPVEAADQLPCGQGELILLVDDEVAMRAATREILELHNYRVLTAGNGQEAVACFVEHRAEVKLVLTDVEMPVMDGLELIRSLRVLDGSVRCLLLTGSEREDTVGEWVELGLTEILRKPCDAALLLKTLHRMFQSRGNG